MNKQKQYDEKPLFEEINKIDEALQNCKELKTSIRNCLYHLHRLNFKYNNEFNIDNYKYYTLSYLEINDDKKDLEINITSTTYEKQIRSIQQINNEYSKMNVQTLKIQRNLENIIHKTSNILKKNQG